VAVAPIPRELAVSPTVGSVRHLLRHVGVRVLAAVLAGARWDMRCLRASVGRSIVGVVAAGLMLPAVAGAHRGDGVFTLAEGRWLGGRDVAMLPDGSVVGVVESGAWRITPDGRRSLIPGLGGTGVAATADGGVLAIQGAIDDPHCSVFNDCPVGAHRIVRWNPDVGVSVVAGTGAQGFGGDGGPATEALLNLGPGQHSFFGVPPTGIVARPDGGFVFADTGNGRIRAVDAAGIVRTLPGAFRDPVGLAATPDGGYLVAEGRGRVRRIRSDGAIETVAVGLVEDVVVSVDGTAVLAAFDGRLSRLKLGSQTIRAYLRPRRSTGTFDFAARSTFGWRIALDRFGGLLAVGRDVLSYVPRGPTPWTLAAFRSTRTSRRAVTAVVEATQPGLATLEIARRERVIARVNQTAPAGHFTLRAPGPIRADWYDLRLRLDGADGLTARDEIAIHGARALTIPLARALLGRRQGQESDDDVHYRLGRDCRRFGRRRVDCGITTTEGETNVGVASVTLGRTGVVLRRNYAWGRRGFRRHPRFIAGEHAVQRLSRHDGGRWAWGP
jgi:hypothetical protein